MFIFPRHRFQNQTCHCGWCYARYSSILLLCIEVYIDIGFQACCLLIIKLHGENFPSSRKQGPTMLCGIPHGCRPALWCFNNTVTALCHLRTLYRFRWRSSLLLRSADQWFIILQRNIKYHAGCWRSQTLFAAILSRYNKVRPDHMVQ